MIRRIGPLALCCSALGYGGCGDTIGEQVEVPLSVSGTDDPTFSQGQWLVTLERAELAFGPLYLCATTVPSDELCERAVVEMRTPVSIDVLDPEPRELPPLTGTSGTVRSAVFDYGISWPLSYGSPQAAAEAPGGHSALLAGSATDGARTLRFSVDVDLVPNAVSRMISGTVTEHVIEDSSSRLHLSFEPTRWLRGLDFDALAEEAFSATDPSELSSEPSAELHIEAGTGAYGSIVHEMSAGVRPRFEWSRAAR